ncbi:sugar ABC transporter permease, partial [Streptomyces sp. NPDC051940]|uniref:ABC transporter permease subunit n=1 Tax=Streptomyces sp. NPDC051940 TaxID=3155675 RepID=UPI0034141620
MSNQTDTTPAPAVEPAIDPRLLVREEGFRGYLTEFKRKMRGGELGSLPVIIGLIVIWAAFTINDSGYFSASTVTYIAYYGAGLGLLSLGLVFVLLLGEIDLSVGSVSGLAAAVYAVISVQHGVNAWLALVITLAMGAAIGGLQGTVFAKIGVPAFIVTLAGFLGWQGVMLWVLGDTGTVNLPDEGLMQYLTGSSMFMDGDIAAGYILAGLASGAMLLSALLDQRRRRAAGIPARPTSEIILRTGVLALIAFAVAYVLNQDRGVPNALVLFLALLVIGDLLLRRTTYGRQVFAVGGNIEASRRAGISVPWRQRPLRISRAGEDGAHAEPRQRDRAQRGHGP